MARWHKQADIKPHACNAMCILGYYQVLPGGGRGKENRCGRRVSGSQTLCGSRCENGKKSYPLGLPCQCRAVAGTTQGTIEVTGSSAGQACWRARHSPPQPQTLCTCCLLAAPERERGGLLPHCCLTASPLPMRAGPHRSPTCTRMPTAISAQRKISDTIPQPKKQEWSRGRCLTCGVQS